MIVVTLSLTRCVPSHRNPFISCKRIDIFQIFREFILLIAFTGNDFYWNMCRAQEITWLLAAGDVKHSESENAGIVTCKNTGWLIIKCRRWALRNKSVHYDQKTQAETENISVSRWTNNLWTPWPSSGGRLHRAKKLQGRQRPERDGRSLSLAERERARETQTPSWQP